MTPAERVEALIVARSHRFPKDMWEYAAQELRAFANSIAAPPKEAATPEPSIDAITERLSQNIGMLFQGSLTKGKSIKEVAAHTLSPNTPTP